MDRESFLKERPLEVYDFEVAGLGKCRMRELSETERVNGWELWLRPDGKFSDARAKDSRLKMIVLTLVGDDDKPLLTDKDIPALRNMPAGRVSQLVEVAMKCMGMSEDDMLDKIKKNASDSEQVSDG